MDAFTVLVVVGICFVGGFLQAATGFGFAVVVMGVLAALMPSYGEAAGLANLLVLCASAYVVFGLRGHIRWKAILWPLIAFAPVSLLMVRFIAADAGGIMQKLLGGTLIALSAYMFFLQGRFSVRLTPVSGLLSGAVSGVLGGLFCMGGVPMALYLFSMEKEDYLATIQTFFAVVAVYSAVIHGASGFLTGTALTLFLYAIGPVVLGTLLGKRFFERTGRETLKKLIYGFMLLSGVFLLLT